ncbi:hypothetical protein OGAPHI_004039 [Ogataea philodendri]|uniref:Uncharacterized protein n=1 Tax=Ogataea philodendri TaxID=1378263 RepID=A0A9P8T4L6_9ASCO|nr:uncharacterized protein OGAPHI_004039 [Ogataea philodendri]KAH3665851.1 hypothetical protein OGAPHI_004039 [Ogataea philodendri]
MATSRSALAVRNVGDFPPSSNSVGVSDSAALAWTILPTEVEPVNMILSYFCSSRALDSGSPPLTILSTSGSIDSDRTLVSTEQKVGHLSYGSLSTTLFPALRAPTRGLRDNSSGKLNGDTIRIVPRASFSRRIGTTAYANGFEVGYSGAVSDERLLIK